jgi:hypothetical protein
MKYQIRSGKEYFGLFSCSNHDLPLLVAEIASINIEIRQSAIVFKRAVHSI